MKKKRVTWFVPEIVINRVKEIQDARSTPYRVIPASEIYSEVLVKGFGLDVEMKEGE